MRAFWTLKSSVVENGALPTWPCFASGRSSDLAINPTTGAWTYTLDNGDVDTQALKEGQTVTETFTATVTDDFGATATQVVTLTITGANDSPLTTANSASPIGSLIEEGNLDNGTVVAGTLS